MDHIEVVELKVVKVEPFTEWSGSPDPADPDNFWIDDATGERRKA